MPGIFDLPPLPLAEEHVSLLAAGKAVEIERIVSTGQTTGWQCGQKSEFVVLLEGEAELEFKAGRKVLQKGDYLLIPAGKRHRVSRTSREPACVWLCVHFEESGQ